MRQTVFIVRNSEVKVTGVIGLDPAMGTIEVLTLLHKLLSF